MIRWLACWLGFHSYETQTVKSLYYGARNGKGKNRVVREWAFRSERIGCYHCDWKP